MIINTDCASVSRLIVIGIIGVNGCYISIIPGNAGLIYKYDWYKNLLKKLKCFHFFVNGQKKYRGC